MTDKENKDDDYELPTGIILPQDTSQDYPNWKNGIIFGVIGGLLGALLFWMIIPGKIMGPFYAALSGFMMGFLIIGAIVAFRPQKN